MAEKKVLQKVQIFLCMSKIVSNFANSKLKKNEENISTISQKESE